MLTAMRHRWRGHPPEQVELSPPDRDERHVAYCRGCHERWVWHDHRISDGYIRGMREFGVDEEVVAAAERSNARYEAQRARYDAGR